MDEVQLEDSSFWHFFDSSQQLVIDTASKKKHKTIFIFLSIYSLIIISISIFAPKSHKVKYVESPLSNPNVLNVKSTIDSEGLNLYNRTVSVFFSVQRQAHIYNSTNMHRNFRRRREFHYNHSFLIKRDFQIKSDITYFSNNTQFENSSIEIPRLSLPFSHHHVISDTVKLFSIYGQNSDYIRFDFSVFGHFHHFHSIWYMISVNNPFCQTFNQYACCFFIVQSFIFIIYLLFTCQKRYEQVFTLNFFLLSLLTSFSYIFHYSSIWLILPKIMVLFLQLYMFYMISYVANKQRSIITYFTMLLFVISFISDFFSLFFRYDLQRANLSHGHHLLWHHITIAVSLSTIAAMRSSIDDFAAFTIYIICLCINMFSFWTIPDLTFFFPRLHHLINLEVVLQGMNSIIMCILFAYHRSFNTISRRNQKSNSISMNEQL